MISKFATAALIPPLMLAATQSAYAAPLDPDRGLSVGHQTAGAFAGARFRLQLGPTLEARAGLALAPLGRSVGHDGAVRMRLGEGLALELGRKQPLSLTLSGTRLDQLRFGPSGKNVPPGDRKGFSTLGYVAIGVGVVLVAAFVAYGAVGDAATE
jgi:hypothetical protein